MEFYRAALLVLVSLISTVEAKDYCVYTLFVKTGYLPKAGTNSHISTELFDANGKSYKINNITDWGTSVKSGDHDCFERNKLDVFTGVGECLETPICGLHVSSDGSGDNHGWYCDYIDVTCVCSRPDLPCCTHRFHIQQWLAADVYPYQLTAYRDDCSLVKETGLP